MYQRFLQIHTLTSYPAALLNRDDAGFAKRIPFGGSTRIRISSQCLKRHWRKYQGEHGLWTLNVPESIRSRITFEREIVQALVDDGYNEESVRGFTNAFMKELLGESPKAKASKAQATTDKGDQAAHAARTGQVTILGRPEVQYIKQQIAGLIEEHGETSQVNYDNEVKGLLGKDGKKNLQALARAAGLDAALFGRMVTSDILARMDAAIHVAHAFTVHAEDAESDYFTAVDDLLQEVEGELGSGHINVAELTSGLYYGYLVVDIPQLVSNLEGCSRTSTENVDRTLAADVVDRLVHLVATVSPGAKLGSTAPYAHALWIMLESGSSQPRTFANAFLTPVLKQHDLLANTYKALSRHIEELDSLYGVTTTRRFGGLYTDGLFGDRLAMGSPMSLAELAGWARQSVMEI